MAKYRIKSPDGVTFEVNAPDGATQDDVMAYAQSEFAKKPQMTMKPSGGEGGVMHGVLQGLRDPIDAAAQMVRNAVPESVGRSLDAADRFIGDKIPGLKFAPTDETVSRVNKEYTAARQAQGREGLDVARLGGNVAGLVLNPINKLIPAGATAAARVGSGAAQGALGGALTPVVDVPQDGSYWGEKAAQVGVGALAGGGTAAVLNKAAPVVGRAIDAVKTRVGVGSKGSPAALASEARAAISNGTPLAEAQARIGEGMSALKREGLDVSLPPEKFNELQNQITKSLAKKQELDVVALMRQAIAENTIGKEARLTVGQATRDPMTYARELNLRGIEGVGAPMQDRMAAQNAALIKAVRGNGLLPDAYESGGVALKDLSKYDNALRGEVSGAYKTWRDSGGGSIDVPLAKVVGEFQTTVKQFGKENIPSAIETNLKSYLSRNMSRQTKVFDLEDANNLLSQINSHYDPSKPAQQAALGRIKNALSSAIDDTAEAAPEGADLLRAAIGKARERFQLHDQIPALKDVAIKSPAAQERFVRDYVMGGSIDQVNAMVKVMSPDAVEAIRGTLRRQILEAAAPGAEVGRETATISQAALRRAIDKIGVRKLQAIMGSGETKNLAQVQQVAEWIMKEPVGAVVSKGTHVSAIANLLQKVPGGGLVGVPLKMVQDTATMLKDESSVRNALAGNAPTQRAQIAPEEVELLRRQLNNYLSLPAGAAAASGLQ